MRDVTKCSLYKNGHCQKWRENGKCDPSTIDWFKDRISQCEMGAVCENGSIFGNECFYLTDEDIDALKAGKVLYYVDEYGIFLAYKKEDPNHDK